MPVIGFDKLLNVRITPDEFSKIKKVVRKNRELFYNTSHFVRASIIKHLRDYDKQGKRLSDGRDNEWFNW